MATRTVQGNGIVNSIPHAANSNGAERQPWECPLTLERFVDPVTTECGCTFERSALISMVFDKAVCDKSRRDLALQNAIRKGRVDKEGRPFSIGPNGANELLDNFKENEARCPVTRDLINKTKLISNRAMRELCESMAKSEHEAQASSEASSRQNGVPIQQSRFDQHEPALGHTAQRTTGINTSQRTNTHIHRRSENPFLELRESIYLSMPEDAVVTQCGHLQSEKNLKAMLAAKKADAAGKRTIPCPDCRTPISENGFMPDRAIRNMVRLVKAMGIPDPQELLPEEEDHSNNVVLHQKIDQLMQITTTLCINVTSMQGKLDRFTEKFDIQTRRMNNMLAMSTCDMLSTVLPDWLGGYDLMTIANRKLTQKEIDLVTKPEPADNQTETFVGKKISTQEYKQEHKGSA
jgi:hypothetical protein